MPEIHRSVTRYQVSCLPETNRNARHFTLTVGYKGQGSWTVEHLGTYLSDRGSWEMEPSLFDLETALRLAEEAAPKITVNGHTAADVLGWPGKED